MTTSADSDGRRRSDARRNHARLVAAAREVFAEQGVDASVHAIVDRAGVGIGTLYRHFPTREALVEAIFAERIEEVAAGVGATLEIEDAALAFAAFLEQLVVLHRGDHVLKELLMRYPPSEERFGELRARLETMTEQLLERAHAQGAIRPDFGRADLAVLFWSLGPVLEATEEIAPEAWRRHLGFVLDGLRPESARPAGVPSLDAEQLAAAMRTLREHRFRRRGARPRAANRAEG
jgi:AcrR family transcriptional regulator